MAVMTFLKQVGCVFETGTSLHAQLHGKILLVSILRTVFFWQQCSLVREKISRWAAIGQSIALGLAVNVANSASFSHVPVLVFSSSCD